MHQPVWMLPRQPAVCRDCERGKPEARAVARVTNARGKVCHAMGEFRVAVEPVADCRLIAVIDLHDLERCGPAQRAQGADVL